MFKTILIAATDPNIIYLLQRYAETSGFQAISCGYGKKLLHQARQEQPVVILLEVEPLETSWRQSLHSLKGDPNTQHIPVIAYSCYDNMVCAQDDEIAGYLQKSVMYSDFVSTLEKIGIHSVDRVE
jgi:DNA-binding NtrC family response regulator